MAEKISHSRRGLVIRPRRSGTFQCHEQVVPDQVGGMELGPSPIQGLEDDLGVVALLQLDQDHFQIG
jgi:hypothetical protein